MSIATHLTRAASFLHASYDPATGTIEGSSVTERRMSDLHGVFADTSAFDAAVAAGDPVVYTVHSIEPGDGEGDLHYGIGTIMPGRVGNEYYMTKGHLHFWRPAAEVYIGISGTGVMLMQDEETGDSKTVPFGAGQVAYVPGYTAHRTMNTGSEPLVYFGVFPARAGHDYAPIQEHNFRQIVEATSDGPKMRSR
jgi:glucose-6-phosphate isomerase